MKWMALVIGVLLATAWAVPAAGGPSLIQVDKREKRHYDALDKRIKAVTAIALSDRVGNNVVAAAMVGQQGGTFSGSARCAPGSTLSGGGVSWPPPLYPGYHVIESGPDPGGIQWQATVNTGGSPNPATFPTVYAVCVKAA